MGFKHNFESGQTPPEAAGTPAKDHEWERVRAFHALQIGDPEKPVGVDREKAIIRGVILAQEGPFKSEGRGEFDKQSLQAIVVLTRAAPNGLKSRLAHPDESNDGIDKFLGRFKDPWIDTIAARESYGELKTDVVACVRADLHLDKTALDVPVGGGKPLGVYVMDRAESDPDSLSTSLVLVPEIETRLNPDGTPQRDADGERLPPLWRPKQIHASDVVDTGDAVDGMLSTLSTDELPNAVLYHAAKLMDRQFAGKNRAFVEEHCVVWLHKYLDRRFGEYKMPIDEEKCDLCGVALYAENRAAAATSVHGGPICLRCERINLAMGEGDPDSGPTKQPGPEGHTPEKPGDQPTPEADDSEPLHNGCRSTLAYHHLTLCRLCGDVMTSCGCDHRDKESRVITMAKQACSKCLQAAETGKTDGSQKSPNDDADPTESDAAGSEEYESPADRDRRLRELRLLMM